MQTTNCSLRIKKSCYSHSGATSFIHTAKSPLLPYLSLLIPVHPVHSPSWLTMHNHQPNQTPHHPLTIWVSTEQKLTKQPSLLQVLHRGWESIYNLHIIGFAQMWSKKFCSHIHMLVTALPCLYPACYLVFIWWILLNTLFSLLWLLSLSFWFFWFHCRIHQSHFEKHNLGFVLEKLSYI